MSLICNIIGAVFSFFGFMSNGFLTDLFFLSLMIAVMLPIPMLYINIRNKRKSSDAVYYKIKGARCCEIICKINIALAVFMPVAVFFAFVWIFYIGSHF